MECRPIVGKKWLQCVAVCWCLCEGNTVLSVLHFIAVYSHVLHQCIASVYCISVVHFIAVYSSVLQCAAVKRDRQRANDIVRVHVRVWFREIKKDGERERARERGRERERASEREKEKERERERESAGARERGQEKARERELERESERERGRKGGGKESDREDVDKRYGVAAISRSLLKKRPIKETILCKRDL